MFRKISILFLCPLCFYFVALISVFIISWSPKIVFNWILDLWKFLGVHRVREEQTISSVSAVLEEVIECYCPEMTVVHNQKIKKWIYVLAKTEMIYVSEWADVCQSWEKRADWSSLWELTGKKCGLCLRHPGAGMRLVRLFKEHGWERIMLFPILQNEKEKKMLLRINRWNLWTLCSRLPSGKDFQFPSFSFMWNTAEDLPDKNWIPLLESCKRCILYFPW